MASMSNAAEFENEFDELSRQIGDIPPGPANGS